MRIAGGQWNGRALKSPATQDIRPTSDRLRAAIFNVLAHAHDNAAQDARVIDLFAGTGAMGIEALSRGASFALFVDNGVQARGLLRANIDAFGLGGVTKVFRREAGKLGAMPPQDPFTLAFLDPPYGQGLADRALLVLRDGGWLARNAIIVVEEAAKAQVAIPDGYEVLDTRAYGDTQVLILRHAHTAT